MTLANEAGKQEMMAAWAAMWHKLIQRVSGIKGSGIKRSEDDWCTFQENEIKKNKAKTNKLLANLLTVEIGKRQLGADGNPILPKSFNEQIVESWTKHMKDDKAESGALAFEADIYQHVKKDALATAVAMIQTEDARGKESEECESWAKQVSAILDSCISADGDGGAEGSLDSAFDLLGGSIQDLYAIPEVKSDNKFWLAHQAAAFVACFEDVVII